jgi:hypothetical protein
MPTTPNSTSGPAPPGRTVADRLHALAGMLAGIVIASPVPATEPSRTNAPAPRAVHASATPADASSAADVELLEFLGSDDVEPELQQYLANREPAKVPALGRSDKK